MVRIFTVPTKPYDERLYLKKTVTFKPGFTALVGCNGSGKSTLMRLIKDQLREDPEIRVLDYDDRHNGGHNLMERFGFQSNFEGLSSMMMSSEGERIMIGISDFARGLRSRIRRGNPKEVWIFLDAVGSGLSIDGIWDIKELYEIIMEDNPHLADSIYFVVSTNEYEFTVNSDCLDVTTFRHIRFDDYEAYRDYILQTRKRKDRRLGLSGKEN